MQSLGSTLAKVIRPSLRFPDEAQCQICMLFDPGHPDVLHIVQRADPDGSQGLLKHVSCKCREREAAKAAAGSLRYSEANLPKGKMPRTFENFHDVPGTESMSESAGRFLRREGPRVLLLTGTYGSGKSHVLEAIGWEWLSKGMTVRYDVAASLLDRLRHTYTDESDLDLFTLLEWYKSRNLLLLDDLGMEKAGSYAAEQLTKLVDSRLTDWGYLVIATNKTRDELAEHLGDRLASRVFATNPNLGEVSVVVNTAKDYRT